MNSNHAQYVKHLVERNYIIVINSAIAHCHCLGLHSFIINENPRIRLFIADDHSEIHRDGNVIPIHSHKYRDYFQVINGSVCHAVYDRVESGGKLYDSYRYGRIGDGDFEPIRVGEARLKLGKLLTQDEVILPADALHSVRLRDSNVMWTVTELDRNDAFDQVCFSERKLVARRDLYKPLPNAIEFIRNRFDSLEYELKH